MISHYSDYKPMQWFWYYQHLIVNFNFNHYKPMW
jgi:hypothetical protein